MAAPSENHTGDSALSSIVIRHSHLDAKFVIMSAVAATAGFFCMYQWGSPIMIPQELADLPATAPLDKLALRDAATVRMLQWNSIISLTILVSVSGGILFGYLSSNRNAAQMITASALGLVSLGIAGIVVGYFGWLVKTALHSLPEATLSQMLKTLCLHSTVWGILGSCISLSVVIALRIKEAVVSVIGGGLLGGILAGGLYSPIAAIVFPMEDTDRLIPTGLGNGIAWANFVIIVISLIIKSQAVERSRQQAATSQIS